jgi:hypothetical protein
MQLIANGTQGGTSIPAKQTPSGTPGYGNSGSPGTFSPTVLDPDVFNTILAELVGIVLASGQTLNASNNAQLLQAIFALPGKQGINFSTPGTFSFTVPANVTEVIVWVLGAGGGSGGTTACTGSQVSVSAGANSGTWGWGVFAVTPGTVISGVIGAGGTAGASGGGNGGNGGTSSFGAMISAPGGHGSLGVAANPPPLTQAPPAATNNCSGAAVNGAEVSGQASVSGTTVNAFGGPGGSGPWGGGGSAGGGAVFAGQGYGAGAGGACTVASGSARTGAAGSGGLVILQW